MDRYATHLEPLVKAALQAKTGILELGCGNYSTPILQEISKFKGIPFLCQASDVEWAKQFDEVQIVSWPTWTPPDGKWDMAFLDSEEPTRDRIKKLPALCEISDVVVMHDADAAMVQENFDKYISVFTEVIWYRKHKPWTIILYA